MKRRPWLGGPVLSCCLLALAWAPAEALVIPADTGGSLAAPGIFEVSGTHRFATLPITSPAALGDPTQVPSAAFSPGPGDPTLTPVSARWNEGRPGVLGPNGGGAVSGEGAYRESSSGAPAGALMGIRTAGSGPLDPADRFGTLSALPPSGLGEIPPVSSQPSTSLSRRHEAPYLPAPMLATLWLLGSGLAALGGLAWRRRHRG